MLMENFVNKCELLFTIFKNTNIHRRYEQMKHFINILLKRNYLIILIPIYEFLSFKQINIFKYNNYIYI